jgi:D-threonate/D-erythronate kinase
MMSLRLLADDLTGALDAAAEFVALSGPVQTFWHGAIPSELPPNAALDSGTRESDATDASAKVGGLVHHLGSAAIAFKKIDSLFRGQTFVELGSCLKYGGWACCVLAPAFPYQGRITRGGRQYARTQDGDWHPATGDLVAGFRALGIPAQMACPGEELRPGVNVFDAETDDDLHRIVAAVGRGGRPALWSGTGGLAHALGTHFSEARARRADRPSLSRPILGLFGSDQPATIDQLAACAPYWNVLANGGPASAERLMRNQDASGIALASFDLPAGTPRAIAADRIARESDRLIRALPAPGTLIVAGGETLRGLCQSLGANSLQVRGRFVPGVPVSIMGGGRWNGVTVVSKSGAFGDRHLLRDLLGLSEPGIPERRAS